mmetsp:Transcript_92915/g.161003  ORF Transcript_92915/g.161003 Transcript_92915/m.161003 type:complete len:253 (+) Transcript_92915:196-954(+)
MGGVVAAAQKSDLIPHPTWFAISTAMLYWEAIRLNNAAHLKRNSALAAAPSVKSPRNRAAMLSMTRTWIGREASSMSWGTFSNVVQSPSVSPTLQMKSLSRSCSGGSRVTPAVSKSALPTPYWRQRWVAMVCSLRWGKSSVTMYNAQPSGPLRCPAGRVAYRANCKQNCVFPADASPQTSVICPGLRPPPRKLSRDSHPEDGRYCPVQRSRQLDSPLDRASTDTSWVSLWSCSSDNRRCFCSFVRSVQAATK